MKSNLLLLLAACCILDGVASDDRGGLMLNMLLKGH